MDPVTVFSLIAGAGIIVLLAMFGFFIAYTYLAVQSYDPDEDADEAPSMSEENGGEGETDPMDDPFDLLSYRDENSEPGEVGRETGENGGFVFSDADQ